MSSFFSLCALACPGLRRRNFSNFMRSSTMTSLTQRIFYAPSMSDASSTILHRQYYLRQYLPHAHASFFDDEAGFSPQTWLLVQSSSRAARSRSVNLSILRIAFPLPPSVYPKDHRRFAVEFSKGMEVKEVNAGWWICVGSALVVRSGLACKN